jgi:hypothetical protein
MNRKITVLVALLVLIASFAFAQDLTIDYQYNLRRADTANFFTFSGAIRYLAADKDTLDATTGASAKNSTELFQGYRYDVKGKNTFPDGLRSLFLFAVAVADQRDVDNLTVTKANDGTITIQYVHRGTAYRMVTDKNGVLSLPNGNFQKRGVGYISGSNPQVIHSDFSRDGSAGRIDFGKVWDASIAGNKEIASGVATRTGVITPDVAAADAMYYWQGDLKVTFESNILRISGGLTAVKR